jgi:hypothetical protein
MPVCLGCHKHEDKFTTRDCDGCHVEVSTENVRPSDHLVHEGDWLHEHGARAPSAGDLCATCHEEKFCAGCHGARVPALPSKLHFDEPMQSGMHLAGFLSRHADEARAEPGLCATCHDAAQFCESCHRQRGVAGDALASPHPPGWVGAGTANEHGAEARRDPVACASCHGGAGEALCVSCHSVGGPGGDPHPPGFSSNLPMTAMPCRECHR